MKVAFVVPYFGKFPTYFELFLKSCEYNKDFDWIIFSDNKDEYMYPSNVHFVLMSFEEARALVQSKFEFPISLSKPYKLCDYRPAYGYIFEKYLQGYDYWGYCDIDLLFGDLKKFLNLEKLSQYDKIGHLGHMTLYRNDKRVNESFMSKMDGRLRYREVFSTESSCVFDEWDYISINHIFKHNSMNVFYFGDFMDIYPYDETFRNVRRNNPEEISNVWTEKIEKKSGFASWESGKAFQWQKVGKNWEKKEVAYLHFQKRHMSVEVDIIEEKILAVPNRFIKLEDELIPKEIVKHNRKLTVINKKRYKSAIKKYLYWGIEKSAPIRHLLGLKRRKKI